MLLIFEHDPVIANQKKLLLLTTLSRLNLTFPKLLEEEMEEVERWVEGEEPMYTFGYFCGLQAVQFPPPEQLTIEEIGLVCKALRQMMFSWIWVQHCPKHYRPTGTILCW